MPEPFSHEIDEYFDGLDGAFQMIYAYRVEFEGNINLDKNLKTFIIYLYNALKFNYRDRMKIASFFVDLSGKMFAETQSQQQRN